MGGIGFDVALYLLERGSRATLDPAAFAEHWGISPEGKIGSPALEEPHFRITMLKRSHTPFGHTLGRTTGWVHRAELARNGVRMLKGVEYRRIDAAGVHITVDGKEMLVPADTVIVCAGQEPNRAFEEITSSEEPARRPSSTPSARCSRAPSWRPSYEHRAHRRSGRRAGRGARSALRQRRSRSGPVFEDTRRKSGPARGNASDRALDRVEKRGPVEVAIFNAGANFRLRSWRRPPTCSRRYGA